MCSIVNARGTNLDEILMCPFKMLALTFISNLDKILMYPFRLFFLIDVRNKIIFTIDVQNKTLCTRIYSCIETIEAFN